MAATVALHRARGRRQASAVLLEGPNLVSAAADAGVPALRLFALEGDEAGLAMADALGVEPTLVTTRVLDRLSTTKAPQSPVAVIARPDEMVEPGGRAIVAWGVSDPGNCGTLIRSAAAFGYAYLSGPGSADTWSPKVLRAAAGAHFVTALGKVAGQNDAAAGGRILVAAVARGGEEPGPLPADAALLVGSEAHGLPADVVARCDLRVTIPMVAGVESLNASVAGALLAYLGALGPGTNLRRP